MFPVLKRAILLFFAISSTMQYQGCDIAQHAQRASNLVNCDFRILTVENIRLAGINIQKMSSIQKLNMLDAAKIMTGAASGSFPLSFQLNLEGRNPNSSPAGLNKLEWLLYIDDIQMTSGVLDRAFTIPPGNGTAQIPLQLNFDLKQVLRGKSLDAIVNFGFNLAGAGNKPTRIMIKLKPTIMIGNYALSYPGHINVKTEFTSH